MPKITFTNKNQETVTRELPEGKVLFDALEDNGIVLRHGCLSGSCGTCKINIIENPLGLAEPSPIEQNTLESIYATLKDLMPEEEVKKLNLRLACRAKIKEEFVFEVFQSPAKASTQNSKS